jgi:hypothetical protein
MIKLYFIKWIWISLFIQTHFILKFGVQLMKLNNHNILWPFTSKENIFVRNLAIKT